MDQTVLNFIILTLILFLFIAVMVVSACMITYERTKRRKAEEKLDSLEHSLLKCDSEDAKVIYNCHFGKSKSEVNAFIDNE